MSRKLLVLGGAAACLAAFTPAANAAIGTGADASDPAVAPAADAAVKAAAVAAADAGRSSGQDGTAGAAGVGDPYFPLLGNGGYDVRDYDATLSYDPETDRLDGTMEIKAKALQTLSSFDLDLQQLEVTAVRVNDVPAEFSRDGQELQITPHNRLHERSTFEVAVDYGGIPQTIVGSPIVFGSPYGFLHTAGRRVRRLGAERPVDVAAAVGPSERQGDLDVPGDRAGGQEGGVERPAGVGGDAGRQDHVHLERAAARWPPTWRPSTSATGSSRPARRRRERPRRSPWTRCCRPSPRGRLDLLLEHDRPR